MSGVPVDREVIRRHLDTLYGTADRGHLAVWHHPTEATVWCAVDDLETAAATIARVGQTGNCYVGVGLHAAPPATGRGKADGVCAIPGLWVDIDLAGPGHKADNLPPDIKAAGQLVTKAMPGMPPTYAVATGGGLHAYWLFREAWEFDDDQERDHAKRMNRALQWTIRREARNRGWHVDDTADLARVLRPAGTVNRKAGIPERAVTVLRANGPRYGIEDLEAVLPLEDAMFSEAGNGRSSPGPGRAPTAHWSRIVAQCGFLRHCVDDAAALSEPEWHGALTVVARCVDGAAIAHRISAGYPLYDPTETQAKFDYAVGRDNPIKCQTVRRDRGGEPWCARCPHWQRITSPVQLGYPKGHRAPAPARERGTGDV